MLFSTPLVCVATETHPIQEFTPQYNMLSYFYDGVALAKSEDKYQVVDSYNNVLHSGNTIISFKNGMYRISQNAVVGIYDSSFNLIISLLGISAKAVVNDRVSITDETLNQWLYNLNAELLLTVSYDDIIYGNGDCVILDDGTDIFVYDLINQKVVMQGIEKCTSVDDNYVVCIKDGKYGIVNFNGDVVIDFKYSTISRELSSEYFYCVLDQTLDIYNARFEKAGSVDISKYSSYKNLSEGMICVRNANGNYLYVDVNGTVVLADISVGYNLTNCNPFYEGLAVITTANGSTYINRDGELATDKLWDGAYRFANGYALVYNNIYDEVADKTIKQWHIINDNFDVVKTLDYDVYVDPYYPASTDFSDGSIRTIDNETNLMGFICLENYNANSNNRLKLSPTTLFQIDETTKTLSGVFNNTTSKSLKNHFLNDAESLVVRDANGTVLSADDIVTDGCKVQLVSATDGVTVLDELTIEVSEDLVEPDPPVTDPDDPSTTPNNPDKDSNIQDFIDSTADKLGITSGQLLLIAGGSLAALVLLIVIIVAVKRKRRQM